MSTLCVDSPCNVIAIQLVCVTLVVSVINIDTVLLPLFFGFLGVSSIKGILFETTSSKTGGNSSVDLAVSYTSIERSEEETRVFVTSMF